MSGTKRAFVAFADRSGIDRGREIRRIHRGDVRRVDEIDAGLAQLHDVVVEGARIAVEILVRTELQRVDEDGGDDGRVLRARAFDQRQMPRVQCAHRRNQSERMCRAGQLGPHLGRGSNDAHVTGAARAASCGR